MPIQYAEKWNCPHCGTFYDPQEHPGAEEATISGIVLSEPAIPHIPCPACRACMDSYKKRLLERAGADIGPRPGDLEHVYWLPTGGGLSAYDLRIIADELDARNAERIAGNKD